MSNQPEYPQQPPAGWGPKGGNGYPPVGYQPTPMPYQPVPVRPKRVYTKTQGLFALLCLALGYLFVKLVLAVGGGVGITLFVFIFGAVSLGWCMAQKRAVRWHGYLSIILLLGLSTAFLWFDMPEWMALLHTAFLAVAMLCWLYAVFRDRAAENSLLFIDILKAAVVLPFAAFGNVFPAIGGLFQNKKKNKTGLLILLGIALAIPITLFAGSLLISADEAFREMMKGVTEFLENWPEELFIFIFQCGIGLPCAMVMFSVLYSNAEGKGEKLMPTASVREVANTARFCPQAVAASALTPVLLVYILFFIAQFSYFFGQKPDAFSSADYARSGFFELCAVAALNMCLIICLNLLVKRKEGKNLLIKGYTLALCLFTLLMIAIALRKMALYIGLFGLTPLRVYTSWFMALLALVFVVIALKQFIARLKETAVVCAVFVVMVSLLTLGNVDGLIARYNVTQYQNTQLKEVDINMMYRLSDSAVEYVIPLLNDTNPDVVRQAADFLYSRGEQIKEKGDIRRFNLSTEKARDLIEQNREKIETSMSYNRETGVYWDYS